jgi:hypothetical protein
MHSGTWGVHVGTGRKVGLAAPKSSAWKVGIPWNCSTRLACSHEHGVVHARLRRDHGELGKHVADLLPHLFSTHLQGGQLPLPLLPDRPQSLNIHLCPLHSFLRRDKNLLSLLDTISIFRRGRPSCEQRCYFRHTEKQFSYSNVKYTPSHMCEAQACTCQAYSLADVLLEYCVGNFRHVRE